MELYITYNEISCRYPTTNLSILTTSLCVHSDFCSNANGGGNENCSCFDFKIKTKLSQQLYVWPCQKCGLYWCKDKWSLVASSLFFTLTCLIWSYFVISKMTRILGWKIFLILRGGLFSFCGDKWSLVASSVTSVRTVMRRKRLIGE